jgi:hypothetical protein
LPLLTVQDIGSSCRTLAYMAVLTTTSIQGGLVQSLHARWLLPGTQTASECNVFDNLFVRNFLRQDNWQFGFQPLDLIRSISIDLDGRTFEEARVRYNISSLRGLANKAHIQIDIIASHPTGQACFNTCSGLYCDVRYISSPPTDDCVRGFFRGFDLLFEEMKLLSDVGHRLTVKLKHPALGPSPYVNGFLLFSYKQDLVFCLNDWIKRVLEKHRVSTLTDIGANAANHALQEYIKEGT